MHPPHEDIIINIKWGGAAPTTSQMSPGCLVSGSPKVGGGGPPQRLHGITYPKVLQAWLHPKHEYIIIMIKWGGAGPTFSHTVLGCLVRGSPKVGGGGPPQRLHGITYPKVLQAWLHPQHEYIIIMIK